MPFKTVKKSKTLRDPIKKTKKESLCSRRAAKKKANANRFVKGK